MERGYTPPYTITENMMNLVAEISEIVGRITSWEHMNANPKLRRNNRIRTIHASLAIENNTLSLEQVTAIINGKRVLGAPAEIREVQNAYQAYDQLLSFDPYSLNDLLHAHGMLMNDLVGEAGVFRSGGVGVFNGDHLIHMAPPAEFVHGQIADLLAWAKDSKTHPLIKSCIFHYEFEFIHPFADGNGRMGRMWHTLLLYQWKPLFAWLPVESVIRERQEEYYAALRTADSTGQSTPFVEFLLKAVLDALREVEADAVPEANASPTLRLLLEKLGNEELSASELMHRLGLKNRAAFSRTYLKPALEQGLIQMTIPDKPNSSKQRYKRK